MTVALEREGWEVHTQLEDESTFGAPLEDLKGTVDEREEAVLAQLKALDALDTKRALILCSSHIGGHKFAGNCIVCPHSISCR